MLRAFVLAAGQLGDPPILAVLVKSLAVTLLLIALLGTALWFGMQAGFVWLGAGASAGVLAGFAAIVGALLAAWLLFRAVAVAVVGLFADDVVRAVEARHYPQALAGARAVPLARSIGMGLGSAGRALLVNLALAPVYLALLVTGVGTALLFIAVNGWLLGRDLGDMVAARHIPAAELKAWRQSTGAGRFALGLIGTGLFLVPILNLVAPVLGAAMATHWFHQGRTT